MKKILFLLLVVFLAANPISTEAGIIGDVNGDGQVSLHEAIYALQVTSGVVTELPDSCLITGAIDWVSDPAVWTSGTDYNLCDVVNHAGTFYIANDTILNSTTEPSADTTNWSVLAVKGDPGETPFTTNGNDISFTAGNVGIGTDTPTNKLHLYEPTFNHVMLEVEASTDREAGLKLKNSVGEWDLFSNDGTGDFKIVDMPEDNTVLMVENGTGNIGVGTTTPDAKLNVFGDIKTKGNFIAVNEGGHTVVSAEATGDDPTAIAPVFVGKRARGTLDSKTAVQAGDLLSFYGGKGYDGTDYPALSSAGIAMLATENHSPTGLGSSLSFMTTPNGSTQKQTSVRITDTGNVGIGIYSPASKLDVNGDITVSGNVDGRDVSADGAKLDAISENASDTTDDAWQGTDNVVLVTGHVGIGTASPNIGLNTTITNGIHLAGGDPGIIFTETGSNTQLIHGTGHGLRVGYNDTTNEPGLIVDMSSNVGVGVEYPTEKLDIDGNIAVSGTVDSRDLSEDGIKLDNITANAADTTDDSWTGTDNVYMTSGNVGIGTASPTAKLHVSGDVLIDRPAEASRLTLGSTSGATPFITFGGTSGGILETSQNTLSMRFGSNTSASSVDFTPAKITFRTGGFAGYERLAIDGAGNIGIGTTAPSAKLQINHDEAWLQFKKLSTASNKIVSSGGFGVAVMGDENNYGLFINGNTKNVGIDNANPNSKLDVNGDITVNGTVDGRDVSADGTKLDGLAEGAADTTDDSWAGTGDVYTSTGKVGIGTSTPEFKLTLSGDGGILAEGDVGSGSTLTTAGGGTRMFWYPRKAAFRAGEVSGTQWDDAQVGVYSFAFGSDAIAGGYSISMGEYTFADYSSIALGYNASASNYSTSSGRDTSATDYSTAMGVSTTASSVSTAIGGFTVASRYSTAMGNHTFADYYSTAMGDQTTASGSNSTAMGTNTIASGDYSTAMGRGIKAESLSETAIGQYNTSDASASPTSRVSTNRLFVVGNGYSDAVRSDALVVLKNGNVGVGIATPSQKLTVLGDIAVSGTVDGRDVSEDGAKLDSLKDEVFASDIMSTSLTFTANAVNSGDPKNVADKISRTTGSLWTTYGFQTGTRDVPNWLMVDFGEPRNIKYFGVHGLSWNTSGSLYNPSSDWQLQGSSDATTWNTVWSGPQDFWTTGANGSYPPRDIIPVQNPGNYRYYRIYGDSFNDYMLVMNWAMYEGVPMVAALNNGARSGKIVAPQWNMSSQATSWEELWNGTINLLADSVVTIHISGQCKVTSGWAFFGAMIDGTTAHPDDYGAPRTYLTDYHPLGFSIPTSLSAGSHTIGVGVKKDVALGSAYLSGGVIYYTIVPQ